MGKPIEDQAKECYSKRRYRTPEFAEKIANECFQERRVKLRVYACPICCGWHLTSKVDKE